MSQEQFKVSGYLDRDGDGVGEFGTMRELGAVECERLTTAIHVPLISQRLIPERPGGRIERSGYYFQLYLPSGPSDWTLPNPASLDDASADESEQRFLILAWPADFNNTGKRCFFIDAIGTVKAAGNEDWMFSGDTNAPSPALATLPGFSATQ